MTLAGRIATTVSLAVALTACKSDSVIDSGGAPSFRRSAVATCGTGQAGCPCDSEGAQVACGTTANRFGDYITCAMGQSTCRDGMWQTCEGSSLVTKSLVATTLGASGIRPLALTLVCPNPHADDPCDPNACAPAIAGAWDVDASTIQGAGEGGVTLIAADASAPDGAAPCRGLQCSVANDCGAHPTTLTGTVYDPAGKTPIYNALVYIPVDPSGTIPPFSGPASCDRCDSLAVDAIAIARTGPDGTFELTSVPSGQPVPLVVQVGRWRREVMLPAAGACRSTPVDPANSRLPRSMFDGMTADIPRMAIATGSGDATECLLLRMGLDPAEFQLPGQGTRRIDYYVATGEDFFAPGAAGPVAPRLPALVGSSATLAQYDAVLLPCSGGEDDGNDAYADNVAGYANMGGRIFTSHFSYTWLAMPTNGVANSHNPVAPHNLNPFYGIATWALGSANYGDEATMASVDTTLTTGNLNFPKGRAFSTWLTAVGAQSAPGELALTQARRDIGALNAPATEWLRNAAAPGETFFFSFNTPLPSSAPAATACGRVMFSDFHASAGDVVDVAAAGACHSDADCGYGASCAPTSLGACTPLSCLVDADCGLGNTCAAGGMCAPTPCDYSMPCRDGEICTSGLCTGCLDATYCPSGECSRSAPSTCTTFANAFPYACLQGPLTPQEQALEFLLLDLTNCISPDDSTPPIPASLARPANTVLFSYAESTFTEDFSADCPDGTRVVWRELDWSSVVPDTASIAFSVQTAAFAADGGSPDWAGAEAVALPTDTTGTANGYSLIDTVMLLGDGGPVPATTVAGAFNQASPPVVSRANLRLTVTLNPTTDRTAAPTLLGWSVKSDCLPSE